MFTMMSSLILILLSFISQAAAYPTADTNVGISNLTSLADGVWPTNLPNGTVVFNNVTAGDERVSWLNSWPLFRPISYSLPL